MPGGAHEVMKAWAPEEDELILEMVKQLGFKWMRIVEKFPGRTPASIRNRFARIKKGEKLIAEGAKLKNKCHACGEIKRGHICKARVKNANREIVVAATSSTSTASAACPGPSQTTEACSTSVAAPSVIPPELRSQGVSVEANKSDEKEPTVPLVLKDLFPNDKKALEEAAKWAKEKKDHTLIA